VVSTSLMCVRRHLDLQVGRGVLGDEGRAGRDGLAVDRLARLRTAGCDAAARVIDGSRAEHRRGSACPRPAPRAMLALCETVESTGATAQVLRRDLHGVRQLLAHRPSRGTAGASQKLLSTIVRLQRERNQKFRAGGSSTCSAAPPRITQNDHASLSTFGIGTELGDQGSAASCASAAPHRGILAVQARELQHHVVTEALLQSHRCSLSNVCAANRRAAE
jgi:ATP-dependent DNA helicase RecQ